ncbi:MAG TPA: DUF2784 domain-containing protein [Gemmataceae bacterium]|nr:DUF2784 domain-containing protein [Gemmataceae bacterium]
MGYQLLADLVVVAHFAFILFVLGGGLLVLRWRRLIGLHLPAAAWGAFVEFSGWTCPLTPLEVWLRQRAGGTGYQSGFVEHYLLPLIYPAGWTPTVQLAAGLFIVVVNGVIYSWLLWSARPAKSSQLAALRRGRLQ